MAKLKSDDRLGQEEEFLTVMQETLTKLWTTLDPTLVIFPWKKGMEGSKPIQKGEAFPSNRDAFADFTEKVFLKRGENVWIRLHVGHNKQITALKDDRMLDHFRQKDMLVYKRQSTSEDHRQSGLAPRIPPNGAERPWPRRFVSPFA
jgi:hypothetical protein